MEAERMTISLTDENGNNIDFQCLDVVKLKNQNYAVLLPMGIGGQILVLKTVGEDFMGVDRKTADTVLKVYREKHNN